MSAFHPLRTFDLLRTTRNSKTRMKGANVLTFGIALLAGVFCLIRAVVDLRQRKYIWAALGALAGVALIITAQLPTHAEKIDVGTVPTR